MLRHTADPKTLPLRATTSPTHTPRLAAPTGGFCALTFSSQEEMSTFQSYFPGNMCPPGAPPTVQVRKGRLERTLLTDRPVPGVPRPSGHRRSPRSESASPPHAIQVTLGPHPQEVLAFDHPRALQAANQLTSKERGRGTAAPPLLWDLRRTNRGRRPPRGWGRRARRR